MLDRIRRGDRGLGDTGRSQRVSDVDDPHHLAVYQQHVVVVEVVVDHLLRQGGEVDGVE